METNTSGIPYNPASVAITGGTIAGVTVTTSTLTSPTITSPTITGGSISGSVTGVPVRLLGGAMPFVHAPTGTMANNGAVTFGTALSRTIASAWMLFPAGAIAAGVPAADTWYYVQMSSTTAGTVFNNTYSTGSTAAPASPTAFATTGPGAFTGSTSVAIGPNVTVTAGAMGALGIIHCEESYSNNNSAGAKTFTILLGSTTFWNTSATTGTTSGGYMDISNVDATHQMVNSANILHPLGAGAGATFGTENTANALVLAHRVNKAVATDVAIIERYADLLIAGAP